MKKVLVLLGLVAILASSCSRDEYEGRNNKYANNSRHQRDYSHESKKRNRAYARTYGKDWNKVYSRDYDKNRNHNRAYNGWDYGRY